MKKLMPFLSFIVLLTTFSCVNEPLDIQLLEMQEDLNNDTGSTNNDNDLLGTWNLVAFEVGTNTTTTINGIENTIDFLSNSANPNYDVTITASNFTTSGSYDADYEMVINGVSSASGTNQYTNVTGSGSYSTSNNNMTVDGSFFDLAVDGIDTSALGGEQTVPYLISADGQTLTFNQNETHIDDAGGFVTTTVISSTSVWEKEGSSNGGNNGGNTVTIEGTWKLTAWNVANAQDVNNDGVESINLLDEINCYENETLVFNADNTGMNMSTTYAELSLELEIGTTDSYEFTQECIDEIENTSLTWSQSGDTITTIDDNDVTLTFTVDEDQISVLIPGGFFAANGDFTVTTTEDLTFVYTKQ